MACDATTISYYPVANGDTSLIETASGLSILIDCNIREPDPPGVYDVAKNLRERLGADAPRLDVFLLTHPDKDHCRGFEKTFHTGDPSKWKKSKTIRIDEIWASPRLLETYPDAKSEDAQAVETEVKRRLDLWNANHKDRDLPGNRLRVVGWGEKVKAPEEILLIPGNATRRFNTEEVDDLEFFIHAPFKHVIDSDKPNANEASIVVHATFGTDGSGKAWWGGDTDHAVFKEIQDATNDDDRIKWNLMLAPHHCSWTYFNTVPYDENKEPQQSSLDLLDKGMDGCMVIASSKAIKDDDDNPPHFPAAEEYRKKVTKSRFRELAKEPKESAPKPLRFQLEGGGLRELEPDSETDEGAPESRNIEYG